MIFYYTWRGYEYPRLGTYGKRRRISRAVIEMSSILSLAGKETKGEDVRKELNKMGVEPDCRSTIRYFYVENDVGG